MNKANTQFEDEFLMELQTIESSIVQVYRSNGEVYDSQVERALNVAISDLKAKQRNVSAKAHKLSGIDLELYKAITDNYTTLLENSNFTVDNAIECLKRLRKSVQRWTKQLGRQGYLNFVSRFV